MPYADPTHVVAADATHLCVRREAAVDDIFGDLLQRVAVGNASPDEIHHLLVAEAVPDAIARKYEELFVARELVSDDLRISSHDLLLREERRVLLELKVANRATQSKIAVDSVELNESASIQDA